jgi:catechol 2,3-dioxygenase-like lactoylglutathione lyase family enzyme
MIHGVSYVGIGVSDIEESLTFYRDILGFKEVLFDYEGALSEPDFAPGTGEVKARVVMLRNPNVTPIAQGMIELVQVLPPHVAHPQTAEYEWGNIGIAEVCQDVRNIEEVSRVMVEKGFKIVMPIAYAILSGEELKYCYFRSPERVLLELIEWHMYKEFGGTPRLNAINHIAIGVTDLEKSLRFYKDILGFKEVIFDCGDAIAPPFVPGPAPRIREILLANEYCGAWIELYQHKAPYNPGRASPRWGDIGLMEFAIHVSNIQKEYDRLQREGVEFLSPPQTIEFSSSKEWQYTYLREPDGLRLLMIEY